MRTPSRLPCEATYYNVIGNTKFQLTLVRRLDVVDRTGILANWRVQCEAPTLITHHRPFGGPDPDLALRLPLISYTEALSEMSQMLVRRYMLFYDRESVLNALRLSLPLNRATDRPQRAHPQSCAVLWWLVLVSIAAHAGRPRHAVGPADRWPST